MNKSFATRLKVACDGHTGIPPYGKGRQTWICEQMGVSPEAVRKWFTGESRPRPSKMVDLARLLEVDEAWLSLGVTPGLEPRDRRSRNAQAGGAVNLFLGLMQLNGANCAFPDPKDPRSAFVDFYSILSGVQTAYHVAFGEPMEEDGVYRFVLPIEFGQATVVGVIHARAARAHLISFPEDQIVKHGVQKGGYVEIFVTQDAASYRTGDYTWPRINSFATGRSVGRTRSAGAHVEHA